MIDASASTAKIRVLIVEDSPTARELLVHIFESAPGMSVAGVAHNGEEAMDAVERLRPDVITMDVNMPGMNGFQATQQIMQRRPTPIVIVSGSFDPAELRSSFEAVQAGATAIMAKPQGMGHPDFHSSARELVTLVRLMSEVKVVRRWAPRGTNASPVVPPTPARNGSKRRDIGVLAIGASTGGPMALQALLKRLPADLPFPVLIVQHMSAGFLSGFVEWLGQSTGFPIREAREGEPLLPGQAYVAPDGVHMRVGSDRTIALSKDPPEAGLRPAVSLLFQSVAKVYGSRAAAVLLSGMGVDGAKELAELRELGALTLAQDKESCIVFGMPGEAARLGAASALLPPEEIGDYIAALATRMREGERVR